MQRYGALFLALLSLFSWPAVVPAEAGLIPFSYDWSKSMSPIPLPGGGTVILIPASGELQGAVYSLPAVELALAGVGSDPVQEKVSYSLVVDVTDIASGKSGELKFSGELTVFGSLVKQAANVFDQPQTQSLSLGRYSYTVSLYSFDSPLTRDGVQSPGYIRFSVGIGPSFAPEPGALALAALGAPLAGAFSWRRRRQRPAK